jgi:hypothetical protein
VSKVHHVGGIHTGAALAGTAWLCAFAVLAAVTPGVSATTRRHARGRARRVARRVQLDVVPALERDELVPARLARRRRPGSLAGGDPGPGWGVPPS